MSGIFGGDGGGGVPKEMKQRKGLLNSNYIHFSGGMGKTRSEDGKEQSFFGVGSAAVKHFNFFS